jgi:hypothetical protein
LIGLGIPEFEAKRYEGKLREGNILLSVHTENSEEVDLVKRIFEESAAQDIGVSGESAAKEKRPAPAPELSGRGYVRQV